jgi:8-oxo-dGTP diphosphatase
MNVACAIIVDEFGAILVTQRSLSMTLPLKWEFPGRKVEDDEIFEQTIVREVYEELNLRVSVIEQLSSFSHNYESFTITLIPFICKIEEGVIILTEHEAFCWLSPNNLLDLDWAAADIPVAEYYLQTLKT